MIAPAMRFEKWQALGNDYLIVEQAEAAKSLPFSMRQSVLWSVQRGGNVIESRSITSINSTLGR